MVALALAASTVVATGQLLVAGFDLSHRLEVGDAVASREHLLAKLFFVIYPFAFVDFDAVVGEVS